MNISFIGCGHIAKALIKGFSADKEINILGFDKLEDNLNWLEENGYKHQSLKACCDCSEIIFLCVRPQDMHDLCKELARCNLEDKKIVSVAAGIKLDQIEKLIPRNEVYRVMPNIGSKNNLGITAVFSKNDNQELLKLLKVLGEAYEVNSEDKIDLHTVLLGSTPAFFYDLLYEFESRAEELINDKDQIRVATIVFLSSLITSISKGQDLLELVESVASKGGTTEAGINFLRERRFNEIFSKAVDAGIIRARELSED